MILFYSVFCNHCKMLLEHIKRYDKEKIIKLVSIDDLRNKNINIESKIHSVPAFMILPSKEILFGKAVFDHLLLPGRGILCSSQNTRMDKTGVSSSTPGGTVDNDVIPLGNSNSETEDGPLAFTLNTASFSDKFSIIEDETMVLNDKNYNWDLITNDNNISDGIPNMNNNDDSKNNKNIQSMEELIKLRESQKF
jgi:hypothetical protein